MKIGNLWNLFRTILGCRNISSYYYQFFSTHFTGCRNFSGSDDMVLPFLV